MNFEDRDETMIWIIDNQFGRRNIPSFVNANSALTKAGILRKKGKHNQGMRTDLLPISAKSYTPINTRQELAVIAGVGQEKLNQVEKILQKAPNHIKEKARSGEMKVNVAYKEMQKELGEVRICPECGKEKPLSDFYSDKGNNAGIDQFQNNYLNSILPCFFIIITGS